LGNLTEKDATRDTARSGDVNTPAPPEGFEERKERRKRQRQTKDVDGSVSDGRKVGVDEFVDKGGINLNALTSQAPLIRHIDEPDRNEDDIEKGDPENKAEFHVDMEALSPGP
jgi:hypothetical protein